MEKQSNNPVDTLPFYIRAEERIMDLADAIFDSADIGVTGCIRLWAQEIVAQCDLIEHMRRRKVEQARAIQQGESVIWQDISTATR